MSSSRFPRMDGDGLFKIQKNLMRISGDTPRFQVVFELGIVILIAVCFLSYHQIKSYMNFVSRISEVDEIRSSLLQANLHLREAEASERGFVQSGKDDFVNSYNLAQARFAADLIEADHEAQRSGVVIPQNAEIKKIAEQKYSYMRETMKMRVIGQIHEAQSRAFADDGLEVVSELQSLLEKVDSSLYAELKAQRQHLDTFGTNVTWIIFLGTSMALGLLLMWRNLSSSEKKKLEGLTILLSSKQSELVEAQIKADEADKIKTDFLNNMSHEIRTPLNAIFGLGQLLARTILNSDQSHYLQGIQGSAKSLLELVNGVLDFAKIENQGLDIHLKPIHIANLMKEIHGILQGQAEIKGLDLRLTNTIEKDSLVSDPIRIRQILLNLVGNAIKFTQNGFVEIRVSYAPSNDEKRVGVRFEVIDSGIGIPKDAQEKIFQNFYQTDSSISRRFGGTGLGLAISKAIVSKMEGQIGFQSEGGKGSQFWFEIPMEVLPQSYALTMLPAVQSAEHTRSLSGLRALIVEDNRLNQVVLSGFLRQLGLETHICGSGPEALKFLSFAKIDVIFLDCQMPEMDGFQVASKIREIEVERDQSWKVIASTAHTSQGYREKCLSAGMDEFLPKPILMEELEELLLKVSPRNENHEVHFVPAAPIVQQVVSNVIQLDKKRWEKLQKVPSEKGNFLKEIAQIFLESFSPKLDELKIAYTQKDFEAVKNIAHYLKSSCSDIGAMNMSKICNEIEVNAEENQNLDMIEGLITDLNSEYAQIFPDIKAVA
jgi:signal transduction histidine kinase/DNA-binding response OmpR family regulator